MSIGLLIFSYLVIHYSYLRHDKYVLYFSSIIFFYITTATSYLIWKKEIKIAQGFIFLQLLLDLLIFTSLIFASGGIENPFVSVFYLHAIMGGMLLEIGFGAAYLVLVLGAIAYIQFLSIEYLEFTSSFIFPTFLAQYFVVIASWLLARSLQRHLYQSLGKLNQLKIASERMDRLRSVGALTAGLSHEFASPLNAVKIQLERVIRKDVKPSDSDDHELMMESINRCSEVLKKMNSVQLDSNIHASEKIVVKELIEEIVDVWKKDYPEAVVQMSIDPKAVLSLPVLNFTQVILNLLDNAHEASGETSLIQILTHRSEKELTLSLSDSGSGFAPDVLARFGEPFNSNKVTGTGLGLYSSLLFMNSVGGTLEIKNQTPEKGSKISMIFPAGGV